MLLLLLAVLSFQRRCRWLCSHFSAVAVSSATAETAAGDGVAVLLWPIRRTIGVMVRQ